MKKVLNELQTTASKKKKNKKKKKRILRENLKSKI
jgi:hypothetical protein